MNDEYKKAVTALLRYKAEGDEDRYKEAVQKLAGLLKKDGDTELAEYALAQISIGAWEIND